MSLQGLFIYSKEMGNMEFGPTEYEFAGAFHPDLRDFPLNY